MAKLQIAGPPDGYLEDDAHTPPDGFAFSEAPPDGFENAKPGPYVTKLSAQETPKFMEWVKSNAVPYDPSPNADYDMPGFWKAQQAGDAAAQSGINANDGKLHFTDKFKTPLHKTFSNESIYATPDAPHWEGSKLVDKDGNVVFDEAPHPMQRAAEAATAAVRAAAPGLPSLPKTAAELPGAVNDALAAPVVGLEKAGKTVKDAVRQIQEEEVRTEAQRIAQMKAPEAYKAFEQGLNVARGTAEGTALELAPFTPGEFAQYAAGEIGIPILAKGVAEYFPKTAEFLTKERSISLSPEVKGNLNYFWSEIKQKLGIPQERGLVPSDVQEAFKKGLVTPAQAARLDEGIKQSLIADRAKGMTDERVAKADGSPGFVEARPPVAPSETPPDGFVEAAPQPVVAQPPAVAQPEAPAVSPETTPANPQIAWIKKVLDGTTEAPKPVPGDTYEAAQKRIDDKVDELMKAGKSFEDANNHPDVEKLYAARDQIGQGELLQSHGELKTVIKSVGVPENVALKILKNVYALDPNASTGQALAARFTQRAVGDRSGTLDEIKRVLLNQENSRGVTPETLITNPASPLTDEGRRKMAAQIKDQAESIEDEVYNYFNRRSGGLEPGRQGSTIPESTGVFRAEVIPGTKEFVEQDVVPALHAAAEGLDQMRADIARTFAPASRGKAAKVTAGIVRENAAELARKKEIVYQQFAQVKKLFDSVPKEKNLKFIDDIESGRLPTDKKLQPIASALRDLLDQRREAVRALGTGKLQHFIEDYFPHIWEDPNKPGGILARIFGKRPLEGSKAFLKRRTIPTTKEGIEAGLTPVSYNPVDLALLKVHEMDRYIMGQKIFSELKEQGLAQFVKFGARPPTGFTKIDDKIAKVYQYSEADKGLIQRGQYYAPAEAAEILNHYLSPGLRGNVFFDVARASGNLMNQVQLGMSAFHLTFTTIDASISKVALGVQQIGDGRILRGLGNIARGTDIITQPISNYLKGSKVLKEYFAPGSQGEELGKIVDALIASGGRVKMDSFYHNSAVESFWKALRAGNYPGALLRSPTAILEALAKPIMEVIVPRQKLGVFFDMARYELERLGPGATRQQVRDVLGKAWDSVDNRMGQLVYDNLFWHKTMKDLAMVSVRSLGWNLGTARELGGGLKDYVEQFQKYYRGEKARVTPRMGYVIALPYLVGLLGALYQYSHTGKGPSDLKDYFYPKNGRTLPNGKPERVSLPSYMKDIVAFAKDPVMTISHKLHPLISALTQMFKNVDYFGTRIRNVDDPLVKQVNDSFDFAVKQFQPFSWRNLQKRMESGGSLGSGVESFFGITPAPAGIYRTKAEDRAYQYMIDGLPAARSAEDAAKYQERKKIVEMMRMGEPTKKEIGEARAKGYLNGPNAVMHLHQAAKTDLLKNSFKHLTVEEAVSVYEAGTPQEKKEMHPLLIQKLNRSMMHIPKDKRQELMKRVKAAK